MPHRFLSVFHGASRITLLSASILTSAAGQQRPDSTASAVGAGRDSLTIAVSAGPTSDVVCAIRGSGRLQCWGSNTDGVLGIGRKGGTIREPVYVRAPLGDPSARMAAINVGAGDFACGVTQAGALYCWGNGAWGTLGVGKREAFEWSPVRAATSTSFLSVSGGDRFACGLARTHQVYCWGTNEYGQLGTGDTLSHPAPTPVAGGVRFRVITAGVEATPCGISVDSLAYCWGDARAGLGTGDTIDRRQPTRVATSLRFVDIAGGDGYTCAVSTDHRVYCWGNNREAQLGLPTSVTHTDRPTTPVSGDARYVAVSAGSLTTCGLTTEQRILCWGSNRSGQGGRDTIGGAFPTPLPVASTARFRAVSVGGTRACAITVENLLYCWGQGMRGNNRRSVPERF
jgi:alpha-tubulin suppressor-like RCC1 family protein